MKIVKFLGGLGNQMFQYAFYYALSKRFKRVKADLTGFESYTLHNGYELERVFNVSLTKASSFEVTLYTNQKRDFLTRKMRQILGTKNVYYGEKQFYGFEPTVFNDPNARYFWGYWQNINYFIDVEQDLRNSLIFRPALSPRNSELLTSIKASNAVSIHVRRGDYLKDPLLSGVCDLNYYLTAIKMVRAEVEEAKFFVFSDDIDWCKAHLGLEFAIYVDWNSGMESYIDMQLMSNCKHHIISNSTFSWWGAWLNSSATKIVISPSKWLNEAGYDYSGIIPKEWKTL
jgi:hypothetical protein